MSIETTINPATLPPDEAAYYEGHQAERHAIVAWLRKQAALVKNQESIVAGAIRCVADGIERGEHGN